MTGGRAPGWLVGAALAAWAWSAAADVTIPDQHSSFRSWNKLTSEPQIVPYQLSFLCAALPPTAKAIEQHGPHTNHAIMVYANPLASAAVQDSAVRTFPPGATIAKEKLRGSTPDGVAFMVKHAAGEFTQSGGWEFLYYPSNGAKPTYETCIACHRAGGTKDYLFGRYGQPDIK